MQGLQQPAAAAMQTPAAGTANKSRVAGSSTAGPPGTASRAGVFKTPAAKTPGSAAGAGTAGRAVMVSPAPLTVTKTGTRARRAERGADENQAPGTEGAAGNNHVSVVPQADEQPGTDMT